MSALPGDVATERQVRHFPAIAGLVRCRQGAEGM
jgi:hypothetical protein